MLPIAHESFLCIEAHAADSLLQSLYSSLYKEVMVRKIVLLSNPGVRLCRIPSALRLGWEASVWRLGKESPATGFSGRGILE